MDAKVLKSEIKELLRTEQVRLWDPPYTKANSTEGDIPDSLVDHYAEHLKSDRILVAEVLEGLRLTALQRKVKKLSASSVSAGSPVQATDSTPDAKVEAFMEQPAPAAPPASVSAEGARSGSPIDLTVDNSAAMESEVEDDADVDLVSATALALPPAGPLPTPPPEGQVAAADTAGTSATTEIQAPREETNSAANKKKRGLNLQNPFKHKKKEMVSFENEGFFLRKEDEELHSRDSTEEPVYFDDLSPEEQAQYQEELEQKRKAKRDKKRQQQQQADPSEDSATAVVDAATEDNAAEPAGGPVALRAPADKIGTDKAAPVGWRRSESGTRLVLDLGTKADSNETASTVLSTVTESDTDVEGESSANALPVANQPQSEAAEPPAVGGTPPSPEAKPKQHKKFHFPNISKKKKAAPPSPMAGPISSGPPVKSDFRAKDMLMTDAQRIAVMDMVKNGVMTIDQAIEKVLDTEKRMHDGLGPESPTKAATSPTSGMPQAAKRTDEKSTSAAPVVANEQNQSEKENADDDEPVPVPAPRRKTGYNPFAVPSQGEPAAQDGIRAHEMLVSDEDRISIMLQVKEGKLSVEEAVHKVVEIEMRLRQERHAAAAAVVVDNAEERSQAAAPTGVIQVPPELSVIFSDDDLKFMEGELSAPPLRHASLSRPRANSKRPPSRSKVRESRSLHDDEVVAALGLNVPPSAMAQEAVVAEEAPLPETENSVSSPARRTTGSRLRKLFSKKKKDKPEEGAPDELASVSPVTDGHDEANPEQEQDAVAAPTQASPVVATAGTGDEEDPFDVGGKNADSKAMVESFQTAEEEVTDKSKDGLPAASDDDSPVAAKISPGTVSTAEDFLSSTPSSSPLKPATTGKAAMSVSDWLASIGMTMYVEVFADNGFEELEFVEEIERTDLADMGVTDSVHVDQILAAVAHIPKLPRQSVDEPTAAVPPVPAVSVPPVPAVSVPALKAAQMLMTDAQRIKVMTLVKEGRLTVDEALAKVLQVERELQNAGQKAAAEPQLDDEGFVIVPPTATKPVLNPFEAVFCVSEAANNAMDDESDAESDTESPGRQASASNMDRRGLEEKKAIWSSLKISAADPFASAPEATQPFSGIVPPVVVATSNDVFADSKVFADHKVSADPFASPAPAAPAGSRANHETEDAFTPQSKRKLAAASATPALAPALAEVSSPASPVKAKAATSKEPAWNPFLGPAPTTMLETEVAAKPANSAEAVKAAAPAPIAAASLVAAAQHQPQGMTDEERAARYKLLEVQQIDTGGHSKIYNALNPHKLFVEDTVTKAEPVVMVGVGFGGFGSLSQIVSAMPDDDNTGEDDSFDADEAPEVRLERMRFRAQEASKEFDILKRRSLDLTQNNPFADTSNPFDLASPAHVAEEDEGNVFNEEEFMIELARKRSERDAAEAAHATELRLQHEEKERKLQLEHENEMARFKARSELERQRDQEEKEKVAAEAQDRLETLSFDFTFNTATVVSQVAAPISQASTTAQAAAPVVSKKAPPPVLKKPEKKK